MFSKNIIQLVFLDIKFFFFYKVNQFKNNFWAYNFKVINLEEAFLNIKLFFYDYFFFKKIIIKNIKKIFNIFLFLAFTFLLINLLDQHSLLPNFFSIYFRFAVILLIFYLSLQHSSWLANFLASITYFFLIRFFYLTFSFKIAFLLCLISFFFVKELLNYIFNFLLFRVKQSKG